MIFISDDIYNRIDKIKDNGGSLSNPNYEDNNPDKIRDDYEIEMIDELYLSDEEKTRKREIEEKILSKILISLKKKSIAAPNE